MARFKKFPTNGHEGKLVYSDSIVDNIVKLAVEEIPNVQFDDSLMVIYGNPIKVFFEKDGVHVDVIIKIHYMQSVSEVAFKIQEAIRHNVESMTEFRVANVNVNIHNVYFDEVVEEKAVSIVDEQEEQEKQEG